MNTRLIAIAVPLIVGGLVANACSVGQTIAPAETKRFVELWPDLILKGTELYQPVATDFDGDGNIYVLDAGNYRVYRYSPAGALVGEFGRAGEGPNEFPFLRPGSGVLNVSHGRASVLMPGAQRIVSFSLPDLDPLTLRTPAFLTSLGFDGTHFHGTATSGVDDAPVGVLHKFTVAGEPVRSYGELLNTRWNTAQASERLRRRNDSVVSVSGTGNVFQAFHWWPAVRMYDLDGDLAWERWLDVAWVDETIGFIFDRPRSLVDDLSEARLASDRSLAARIVQDVAASRDDAFVLLAGYWMPVLRSSDGQLTRTFQLQPPEESGPEARLAGYDLAVDEEGLRVCLTETRHARVLCYSLPGAGTSS